MRIKQLTLKERYHIWTLLKQGRKQKEIAESIGVHPSTICREIQRNKDISTQEYHYAFADSKASIRQQSKAKYTVITSKVFIFDVMTVDLALDCCRMLALLSAKA